MTEVEKIENQIRRKRIRVSLDIEEIEELEARRKELLVYGLSEVKAKERLAEMMG